MSVVYWIWLQQAIGVGQPQSEELLQVFDDAKAVYEATDFAMVTTLTVTQRRRLKDKELGEAAAQLEELEELGAWVMTPEDEVYDRLFGGMYAPPLVLYGKGARLDDLDAPMVAVVGTRRCDNAGIMATRRLAAGLAAGGAVVVTGGADGLDSEAMKAALDEDGRLISFQACGIDVDYPKATAFVREAMLQHGGTLLTEFPLGMPALRHHFKIRNRLISAASRGTLVTQAPRGSGALLTAKWAREQGRDVFAAPGLMDSELSFGSNELIKDGAAMVTNAADILMTYIDRYPLTIDIAAAVAAEKRAAEKVRYEQTHPNAPLREEAAPTPPPPVLRVAEPKKTAAAVVPCPASANADMKRIYDALQGGSASATDLARDLSLPASTVMSSLTLLELQGVITVEAGGRYALKTIV